MRFRNEMYSSFSMYLLREVLLAYVSSRGLTAFSYTSRMFFCRSQKDVRGGSRRGRRGTYDFVTLDDLLPQFAESFGASVDLEVLVDDGANLRVKSLDVRLQERRREESASSPSLSPFSSS